jgi:hypothetical protein
MLWKNFVLKKRKFFQLIFEIVMPILIGYVLWAIGKD